MTKNNKQVVDEVKAVISSIKEKLQQGNLVTIEDVNRLSDVLDNLITDYIALTEEYLVCNSLVTKYEKFLEVVGSIEYASVEQTDILDQSINSLVDISKSIKQG